jgi:regulator of cell morphogenesis and NO signaling
MTWIIFSQCLIGNNSIVENYLAGDIMQNLTEMTVREIALEMPQTTRVFEEFKIDYCCGGRRSIMEACEIVGADTDEVLLRLQGVFESEVPSGEWSGTAGLAKLIDHILDTHHVFTRNELENLEPLMDKVVRVHGEGHPELILLKDAFEELADDLRPHMLKEEQVLFPFIEDLIRCSVAGTVPALPHFGTVNNPIRMMMIEHDNAGDILRKMRKLANDYQPPEGACPSYTGLFYRLEELERDLHEHIHLENNVLFPRAVELEESLYATLN